MKKTLLIGLIVYASMVQAATRGVRKHQALVGFVAKMRAAMQTGRPFFVVALSQVKGHLIPNLIYNVFDKKTVDWQQGHTALYVGVRKKTSIEPPFSTGANNTSD